jgi:hypothetical protein
LDDKQKAILNKIIEKEGDCLTSYLCISCPFRTKCLPEFLDRSTRPSHKERYMMAADAITRIELMLDET